MARIAHTSPTQAQQAAVESETYRELLDRMIDERLVEQAADKAHVTVTPEEIDQAIEQRAERLGPSSGPDRRRGSPPSSARERVLARPVDAAAVRELLARIRGV